MRLDKFLVLEKGIESREKAKKLIREGKVKVNEKICQECSYSIKENDKIEVIENLKFVSRGGEKLYFALKEFKISPKNKFCLDVGSSTGGFTDCLLKMGAKKVFALDVGKNQLHPSLRNNPKVILIEQTDIRNFKTKRKFDLITVDVSFISLKLIIEKIKELLKKKGEVILLFKPQFEVGKKYLKRGIVKEKEIIQKSLDIFLSFVEELNFKIVKVFPSPVLGKKGNQEFFIHLKLKDLEK